MLFDRVEDPLERRNLVGDPLMILIQEQLRGLYRQYRQWAGPTPQSSDSYGVFPVAPT